MANKRQRRKQQKQSQVRLLQKSGYSKKQVNKLNSKQIEKITNEIITKQTEEKKRNDYVSFWENNKNEQQRIFRKSQRKSLHRKKVLLLEKLGADRQFLSESVTKYIKLEDIQNGKVNRHTHPDIFPKTRLNEEQVHFDFNKVYKIKNNKAFYFALLDYTGELDLAHLIKIASSKTNKQLIQLITNLVLTAPTYKRGKSASSGKAGTYRYLYAKIETIKFYHSESKEISRGKYLSRNKTSRINPNRYIKGYQELRNSDKKTNYFDEFTMRSILIIAYTFMENITEEEREVFYYNFYEDLSESIPQIYDILPFPLLREL